MIRIAIGCAVAIATLFGTTEVRANYPAGKFNLPPRYHNRSHAQVPVFMAAPWYLYWPYDAHFQTPAPIFAPHYPPPVWNNFPSYPYFPNTGAPSPGIAPSTVPGAPSPVPGM